MDDCREHFADESWVRFLRGLLPPEEAQGLQEHVDRECTVCLNSRALWCSALELAVGEGAYEAPESAVSHVKAAFVFRQKVPLLARLAETARLVFDSLHEPLPAGIRARMVAPRQILHVAGRFLIDLRLEAEGERQTRIAGQIVRSDGAEGATAGTGIALVQGTRRLIALTIANALGEFHLQYDEYRRDLTLYLDVPGKGTIMVPLPGVDNTPPTNSGTPGDKTDRGGSDA